MTYLRSVAFTLIACGATAFAACATPANDGSESSSSAIDQGCPTPALERCPMTITFPDQGQREVELRGAFAGGRGWTGPGAVKMTRRDGQWAADITVPRGVKTEIKFVVDGTKWEINPNLATVGNNNVVTGNCTAPFCEEEPAPANGAFDWRDSVIYFAFVDRFYNGDTSLDARCRIPGVSGSAADYQGGDWAGVTKKIDEGYFNDLGVNTLWITVPMENPNVAGSGVGGDPHKYSGYHGYWPKIDDPNPEHLAMESCFGSEADLKTLVTTAHAHGLKVLFDYAMVHVHASSGLFQMHPEWFWPNSKDGSQDCICGQSCSWDGDGQRCWFTDYLPHWNYTNPAAREWSVQNAVAWIKQTGVDGFRADAIKHVDQSWLTALRSKIESDVGPERFYMVGETYDFFNRDLLKSFVDSKSKLDGQFDFPLRRVLVESTLMRTTSMRELAGFMDSNDYYYGPDAVMSTFIGNHDLPRIIHAAANQRLWGDQYADGKDRAWQNQPGAVSEREAYERVANGFAVLFTNRGAPLVYYGDEIGLPGAGDPDNRRFMQWDGLSDNQQMLRDRIKKLAAIRRDHEALRRGARKTLSISDDTWLYLRSTSTDEVFVALNRSDSDRGVDGLPGGELTDLMTGEVVTGPSINVRARQTRILVRR